MKYLQLNNGQSMPLIGLGTSVFPEDPKIVEEYVNTAIPIGYRHFDTAFLYNTEVHLGNSLQKWMTSGEIKREDFFIVTKLPQIGMRSDLVEKFLLNSLKNLQLEFIDLYLLHWPLGLEFRNERELFPRGPDGEMRFDEKTDLEKIWKAMEQQVKAGRAKSIGVSNFSSEQIERIMKFAVIPPCNNQIEVHAYLQQKELRTVCKKHNITITAYFPLGGPDRVNYPPAWQIEKIPPLLDDPVVNRIAKKHDKSPGQILLRFLTQLDIAVIPKSRNPKRLTENLHVLDFELDSDDMLSMEALEKGENARSCFGLPGCENHPEYPFPTSRPDYSMSS